MAPREGENARSTEGWSQGQQDSEEECGRCGREIFADPAGNTLCPCEAEAYTPGPWLTSNDAVPEGHTQATVYAEGSGERVATAFQAEANARLISAAPDLLEAAKKVSEENLALSTPGLVALDAAIAKAEGR